MFASVGTFPEIRLNVSKFFLYIDLFCFSTLIDLFVLQHSSNSSKTISKNKNKFALKLLACILDRYS